MKIFALNNQKVIIFVNFTLEDPVNFTRPLINVNTNIPNSALVGWVKVFVKTKKVVKSIITQCYVPQLQRKKNVSKEINAPIPI